MVALTRTLWLLLLAAPDLAPGPPPVLTAPAAEGSTEVPYPPGATGAASVLLEVTVEKDGTVSDVVVTEGAAPFAEQARQAVLGWRFRPAQRDGEPVAARIRARVEFREPERPAAAPAPAVAATPAPLVVTVRGPRRETGQATISAAEVRELPGAFGDPFRAIEALPGVTPVVSGLPYFFVRGAPPNDNGYLLDGIRVPLLFHIGIGEGVIHPALLDRVDFFPSVAPASHGGFTGAIVAGQTREPAPVVRGEANLRLVDAGGLVETPFAGGRGAVLLAGRYGFPGAILRAVSPDVRLDYWDYQARATWRVTDRDTVGVLAFGSHDHLASVWQDAWVDQVASDFHRVDLRYDRGLDDGHLRLAVTLGRDVQGGTGGENEATPASIRDHSARLRLDVDRTLSPTLRARGGVVAQLDQYRFQQGTPLTRPSGATQTPVPSSADPPPTNGTAGAYADLVWRPRPRLELVPGLRADLFASWRTDPATGARVEAHAPAIQPRLTVRVALAPAVASLTAAGLAYQYPTLRVGALPAMVVSVPGFPVGQRRLQRAAQVSQGLELALPAEVVVTATGFLTSWSGMTDLTTNCLQVMPPTSVPNGMPEPYVCPDDQPVSGLAYGGELLVRRELTRRLGGWLTYTVSRSTRDARFATLTGETATARVPSENDRTHVLGAILAYQLAERWRAGVRASFHTGAPYSVLAGNVPVPPYNAHRAPAFFRLDVRLERRWSLGQGRSLSVIVEGQNVTFSRDTSPLFLDCRGEASPMLQTTQCVQGRTPPLTIPSLGLEARF